MQIAVLPFRLQAVIFDMDGAMRDSERPICDRMAAQTRR